MINIPPLHSSRRIATELIPDVVKTWKVGQIVIGRAQTSRNAEGELQLLVGKHIIDARSKASIQAGDVLRLQVAQQGAETLLKIIKPATETDLIQQYLRQAVPQTEKIQQLFHQLKQFNQLLPQSNEFNTIKSHLAELLQTGLPIKSINPDSIKQFLPQTGLFSENQLLQAVPPKPLDLKLQLLRLYDNIEQLIKTIQVSDTPKLTSALFSSWALNAPLSLLALSLSNQLSQSDLSTLLNWLGKPVSDTQRTSLPTSLNSLLPFLNQLSPASRQQLGQWIQLLPLLIEVRHNIDASIHTLLNAQLQYVNADSDSAFLLLFNLPIFRQPELIDLFQIKIETEEHNDEETGKHWSVTIQFELPELGAVQAKLILADKRLHTSFSTANQASYELIQHNLPILQSALTQAGFIIGTLTCKHEAVAPIQQLQHIHGPLLDDQA